MGFEGTVLGWFLTFLADRSQKVVLREVCLASWFLRCGVPQVLILSLPTMLFIMYMKPLGKVT